MVSMKIGMIYQKYLEGQKIKQLENIKLKKEIEDLNEQINQQFAKLSENLMETEELKEKLREIQNSGNHTHNHC